MLCSKQPLVAKKLSGSVRFELSFECDCDLTPAFFAGKTEGQSVLAGACHSLVHAIHWCMYVSE